MSDYYILKGRIEVEEPDIIAWSEWMRKNRKLCRIGQDIIGNVRVSTVFLGLDHSFGSGRPLLFETMIFGGEYDEDMWRYHTLEEAKVGHAEAVRKVKANRKIKKHSLGVKVSWESEL